MQSQLHCCLSGNRFKARGAGASQQPQAQQIKNNQVHVCVITLAFHKMQSQLLTAAFQAIVLERSCV